MLTVLPSSTQFVGIANALTYGLSEQHGDGSGGSGNSNEAFQGSVQARTKSLQYAVVVNSGWCMENDVVERLAGTLNRPRLSSWPGMILALRHSQREGDEETNEATVRRTLG